MNIGIGLFFKEVKTCALDGGRPDLWQEDEYLDANSSLPKQLLVFRPPFVAGLHLGFGFKDVKPVVVR